MIAPPKESVDLFHHKDCEDQLFHMITENRLPHAILLYGPQGVGKSTLAFRLARYLLKTKEHSSPDEGVDLFGEPIAQTPSLYVPATDPSFSLIANGSHPNLMVVDEYTDGEDKKTNSIKVDVIRKVNEFSRKTAMDGGWKVVIIDGAENMNPNSANALLKILEEPPKGCLFILVTHNYGRLLPTIRSRCFKLHLSVFCNEELEATLSQLPFFSQLSEEEKLFYHHFSGGSLGEWIKQHEKNSFGYYQKLISSLSLPPPQDLLKYQDFIKEVTAKKNDVQFSEIAKLWRFFFVRLSKFSAMEQAFAKNEWLEQEINCFEKLLASKNMQSYYKKYDKILSIHRNVEMKYLDVQHVLQVTFKILNEE